MTPARERRLRTAIGLLEATLAERPGDRTDERADPSIYPAHYLKAMYLHELGDIEGARQEAERLVHLIDPPVRRENERAAARPRRWWRRGENRGSADPNLDVYLSSIRPSAQIMLGTLEILAGEGAEAGKGLSRLRDEDRHSPLALVQYNFACAHSLLAERCAEASARDDQAELALTHLARALSLNPGYTRSAEKNDPTLNWLRTSAETASRFEELMRGAAPPAADAGSGEGPPLAQIKLIGKTYAGALAERGIRTPDDLLSRAATPAGRAEIAAGVSVPAGLVLRWADLTDLTRVVGIGLAEVNLLHLAGVGSVPELGSRLPPDLAALLAAVAPLSGVEPPVPLAVESWVRQAQGLPAVVAR